MVTLPSFVDLLVRPTTAFNRILRLSGATVQSAAFTEQGLVIALRRPGSWSTTSTTPDSTGSTASVWTKSPPNAAASS
jgi:hypothetical protein